MEPPTFTRVKMWRKKAKTSTFSATVSPWVERYFTLDFEQRVFFYSHEESQKINSVPFGFNQLMVADLIPGDDKPVDQGKTIRSRVQAIASSNPVAGLPGFTLVTADRTLEVRCHTGRQAEQWVEALQRAIRETLTASAPSEGIGYASTGPNVKPAVSSTDDASAEPKIKPSEPSSPPQPSPLELGPKPVEFDKGAISSTTVERPSANSKTDNPVNRLSTQSPSWPRTSEVDVARLKLVVVGDPGVGKTSVLNSYCEMSFTEQPRSTVGIDFISKKLNVDGTLVALSIWDTAGQERFGALTPVYFRDSDVIFIVYDCTDRHTFASCKKWLGQSTEYANMSPAVVLAATKTDLTSRRKVSIEDGQSFAEAHRLLYAELSAATGSGIKEVFEKAIRSCLLKARRAPRDSFPVRPSTMAQDTEKKKRCCVGGQR